MIARVKPLPPPAPGDPTRWAITVPDRRYVEPAPVEGVEHPEPPRVAWRGAWGRCPSLPVGWRINQLRTEMRAGGSADLPYYAAVLGLVWEGEGSQFAARPLTGPAGRWTEDQLVAYGWLIVEELHAVGVPTIEIVQAGAQAIAETIARVCVAAAEVPALVDFTGPPVAASSAP